MGHPPKKRPLIQREQYSRKIDKTPYPCFVENCPNMITPRDDGGRPWFCNQHEASIKAAARAEEKRLLEAKKRPWRKPHGNVKKGSL